MTSIAGQASLPETTEIELAIRGMTCAACAARVQRKLGELPGVTASANLATQKAMVIAPASTPVQRLVEAVEQAGYTADAPPSGAGAQQAGGAQPGPDADRVAYLRRRLIVALVFFVPLSDLSVQLSLFPSFRFPGWQWVLVALAVPVAGWAAWPFHARRTEERPACARRPWTRWCRWASSRPAAGRRTRCSCWTRADRGSARCSC